MHIVNIASYKFVQLDNPEALREDLQTECTDLGIMGTILLGHEGINLILASGRQGIDGFQKMLTRYPEFNDMQFKESFSDFIPFSRMAIKVKPEIVTMGVEGVEPENKPAPRISAKELKQWYDKGKEFIILDTRNDYEFQLGTFENSVNFNITNFREFPEAVKKLQAEGKPIVTFCTGGIRCEKAAPMMLENGFENVYQLDGGILTYFEECGGEHWKGECFVFDDRIALDSDLKKTDTVLCDVCQYPVTKVDQATDKYIPKRYCPNCIDII